MRTSALFGAKNFGFFEIHDVSPRTRGEGVEPLRIFRGQGGSQFFAILDVFYGWPLSVFKLTALYL